MGNGVEICSITEDRGGAILENCQILYAQNYFCFKMLFEKADWGLCRKYRTRPEDRGGALVILVCLRSFP